MNTKENYSGLKGILKFIATVISWALLIFLIIIGSFLVYYLVSTKIFEQKGEKYEPYIALYNVMTESMEPNINPMDVVVTVKIKDPQDIKIGDVITFYSTSSLTKGMTITHRVVEIVTTERGIGYKTKGDNNTSADGAPAEFNNVIGKVIFKIPKLGKAQSLLASKAGWLLIIVVPALFVIISDIVKLFHLNDIKNKITKIEKDTEKKKEFKKTQEEIRKQNIKKRLNIGKNNYEPDPIIVDKPTRIVIGNSYVKTNKKTEITKKNKKKSNNKKKTY